MRDVTAVMKDIEEARAWIADCEWADEIDADMLSPNQIIIGVENHYVGGWDQFVADGNPNCPLANGEDL